MRQCRWMIASVWAAALGGVVVVGATACKDVTCGTGTIERNGACAPEDEAVGSAQCGPFTMLTADTCVPQFPPTQCDPATTEAETDPTTGVTTCIGTSSSGCSAPIACPAPAAGKQSVCGQLVDFRTGLPFANVGATGSACTAGATTGPCAVGLAVLDAVTSSMLAIGGETIDDCGRYTITDIDIASAPESPLLAIAVDDQLPANAGPGGITEATAVGTFKVSDTATQKVNAYIIDPSMVWTGGPSIMGGITAAIFFAHQTGTAVQAGVTVTKSMAATTASYFTVTDTTRGGSDSIDGAATATGANGTAIFTGAAVTDGFAYGGTGGLQTGCAWTPFGGTTKPFLVFVDEVRPTAISGMTCNQ